MMDYTIFGESHGPAVGVLLRDVPPGLPVDEEFICRQLLRRAPQDPLSTARHEPDQVEVLSGVYQGVTTGMPAQPRRLYRLGAERWAQRSPWRRGLFRTADGPSGGGGCSGKKLAKAARY